MLTLQRAQRDGFKLEKEGRLKYIIRRPAGWTRELAEANSRYRPIIFLHGLGIGLGQYAEFIKLLTKSDLAKTHPILVPLFPHTSQAIFDEVSRTKHQPKMLSLTLLSRAELPQAARPPRTDSDAARRHPPRELAPQRRHRPLAQHGHHRGRLAPQVARHTRAPQLHRRSCLLHALGAAVSAFFPSFERSVALADERHLAVSSATSSTTNQTLPFANL